MLGLIEIRRRKVQFALIALVVTLISYLVLMINGLGVGLNVQAGSALKSFDADAIAYSDQAGLSIIRSEMGPKDVAAVRTLPGVIAAADIGYVPASYRPKGGGVKSAAFLGIGANTIAAPKVTRGRDLTESDRRALLADKRFLKASGFSVGDRVEISVRLTKVEFTIVGEVDEGAILYQPAVYVVSTTWRELRYGANPGAPAASLVLLRGEGLAGAKGPGFEVVDKATAFANIEGVRGQQSTVTSLQVFGHVIGALVIGVFFYVLTIQKVPQIGMLKALGASGTYVFRQLVVQALAVAMAGLALALPLAYFTDQALQRLPEAVPIDFTASTWGTTAATLLVTALVGTVFSGRRVITTDPIIALGQQQ